MKANEGYDTEGARDGLSSIIVNCLIQHNKSPDKNLLDVAEQAYDLLHRYAGFGTHLFSAVSSVVQNVQPIYAIINTFHVDNIVVPSQSFSKMKICISYTNSKEKEISKLSKIFNLDPDSQNVLDRIQSVVDIFEGNGITIDQGGHNLDDMFIYELNLPDYQAIDSQLEKEARKIAKNLLKDVSKKLSELEI